MNFILNAIASDPNVDPAFRVICREEADRKNLLTRRAKIAEHRQYEAQPVSITGFGPLHPVFEAEPTADERAADEYQDRRILQDKEQRFE